MADSWMASGVPRWVTLVDEVFFVLASVVFIFGSVAFFPGVPIDKYIEGCELYIGGSAVYLGLAVFATYEILEDARISQRPVEPSLIVEQMLYLVGSALFVAGSVLFTPPLPESSGAISNVALDGTAVQILSVPFFGRTIYLTGGEVPEVPES